MSFTIEDLDHRLCDISSTFNITITLRQWIHRMIKKYFYPSYCNDDKLNTLSDIELTKLINEFLYLHFNR